MICFNPWKILREMREMEERLMATLDQLKQAVSDLEAKVAAETTVEESAITLLTNLTQLLKDALAGGGTPDEVVARVSAVTTQIDAETQKLSQAVVDNTPAAGGGA